MQRLIDLYKRLRKAAPNDVTQLAGAGSNRKYYRLTSKTIGEQSLIGVLGTSAAENSSFISIANFLKDSGINVPQVLAVTDDCTAYLQTDLGNVSLFDLLKEGREADGKYSKAEVEMLSKVICDLPSIQLAGSNKLFECCHPVKTMDERSIMFDLNYFKYCYVKLVGAEFDEYALQDDFEQLAHDLMKDCDTDTFLYRDFQARNIMITNGTPYYIDFQGGRRGPIYYDVASFLWQASARYSNELRLKLITEYVASLNSIATKHFGIDHPMSSITVDNFIPRLYLFVLFRLLQVLGAYGYRGLWEHKQHFIDSIPLALANLGEELRRGTINSYPTLKSLCDILIKNQSSTSEKLLQQPTTSVTDTTKSKISELIKADSNYLKTDAKPLVVRVYSFSFKRGIPKDITPNGGGFVFDCRSTHNPGRYAEYKHLTGLDTPVIEFLEEDGEIITFLSNIYPLVDFHVKRFMERGFTDMMVSFGCTGGQHRSVYSAQKVAEHIHQKFRIEVRLCHREQNIEQTLK